MNKLWAFFFALVPIFGTLIFFIAHDQGWWFPEVVSTYGEEIDDMFWVIQWVTGFTFLGCNGLLCYALFRYAERDDTSDVIYTHGSHKLEFVWTVVTAVALLILAVGQLGLWKKVKFESAMPKVETTAEVVARQFEWRITYPGPDGKIGTPDDIKTVNDFRVAKGAKVRIALRSQDVLHSFFLPHFRLKQDAVPGLTIPVWFEATKVGQYELVCAELCGWGHYKMKGMLTVMEPDAYKSWLKEQGEKNQAASDEN